MNDIELSDTICAVVHRLFPSADVSCTRNVGDPGGLTVTVHIPGARVRRLALIEMHPEYVAGQLKAFLHALAAENGVVMAFPAHDSDLLSEPTKREVAYLQKQARRLGRGKR